MIIGAYHIAMMNNWEEIVNQQTIKIIDSGLLACTDNIFISVVGGNLNLEYFDPRIAEKACIICDPILEHFEFPTLKILRDFAVDRNFKAWYIHTKGVSRFGDKVAENWRILMEYFIIERHRHCIKELDNCDACGIQCHRGKAWTVRGSLLYFSGNFWWANSTYISKLPKVENLYWGSRFNAESWINDGIGNLKTFFNCGEINMQMLHIDMESIKRKYPLEIFIKPI